MGRNLTALFVTKHRRPGRYADASCPGLYLQVGYGGAKSWLYRYSTGGKAHALGLGSVRDISLAQARDAAAELRRQRRQGNDLHVKRACQKTITFKECADAYAASHRHGWKPRYTSLWASSMALHVLPVLGDLPVKDITTENVLQVLTPIWKTKSETASKLRSRIESVLDSAKVLGHRDGENPARWRNHLDKLLPAPGKVRRVEHHRALHYREIPPLMVRLRERTDTAALALRLLVLTAARTSEVVNADHAEFDVENRLWTVPATRMKSGREHRVPLTPEALEIVKAAKSGSELVFPGIHDRALYDLLRRSGVDSTTHGFRSTFRDWAAEQTSAPNHIIEQCLAHSIGKVEAAYRRSDLLEQRRRLMESWARYCSGAGDADVVPLRAQRSR